MAYKPVHPTKRITQNSFWEYENVRQSGEVNMLMVTEVATYSILLTRTKVKYIIKNYGILAKAYL